MKEDDYKLEGAGKVYLKGDFVADVDCDIYVSELASGEEKMTGTILVLQNGDGLETPDKVYLLEHQASGIKTNVRLEKPQDVAVKNTYRIVVVRTIE